MAVLSLLKCLNKIVQSSSYHPATIYISVLCAVPSLRSVTSEDSYNIPSASIWPFRVFTAASTIVMLRGPTQQTCSSVTYICTTSDSIQELLIYQDSSITHTLRCVSAITTEPLPRGSFTRSNKISTGANFTP